MRISHRIGILVVVVAVVVGYDIVARNASEPVNAAKPAVMIRKGRENMGFEIYVWWLFRAYATYTGNSGARRVRGCGDDLSSGI